MTEPRLVPKPGAVCEVRDGRFVTPCVELADELVRLVAIVDVRTGQPTRTFVCLGGTRTLTPLRCCPFCATPHPTEAP